MPGHAERERNSRLHAAWSQAHRLGKRPDPEVLRVAWAKTSKHPEDSFVQRLDDAIAREIARRIAAGVGVTHE